MSLVGQTMELNPSMFPKDHFAGAGNMVLE
jgi:hypothetical protein